MDKHLGFWGMLFLVVAVAQLPLLLLISSLVGTVGNTTL